jgi:hypothetical protein
MASLASLRGAGVGRRSSMRPDMARIAITLSSYKATRTKHW